MNEKSKNDEELARNEETLARLFRIAGSRDEIPVEIESRVYERVLKDWRSGTETPDGARVYDLVQRSWKKQAVRSRAARWMLPIAVAASAVLVAVLMTQPVEVPRVEVGTVAKVVPPATGGSAFALGDKIYVGMTIETAEDQGLSFLLARNESLRLDENSQLRVDDGDRFTLLRGRVYADTGEFVYRDGGLRIDTVFGAVTDIGTQFAVALQDDVLDVAVREGRVDVRRDSDKYIAMSGERLTLARKGDAVIDPLALIDDYWSWTTELAPTFDIEGKSVLEFLKWVARESGRILFFENSELRMTAMRTELHGSIVDFTPLEAVESVLATTAFRYRVEPDRIVIER